MGGTRGCVKGAAGRGCAIALGVLCLGGRAPGQACSFPEVQALSWTGPRAVFAADLNGNGYRDLVVAVHGVNTVAWHDNADGAGGFGIANTITNSIVGPTSVFASDLDGDGDLDVICAADDTSSTVVWFENSDGVGTFTGPGVVMSAPTGARSVYAADLDGDSDRDIVAAFGDTVAWYENRISDGDSGPDGFAPGVVITSAATGASSVVAVNLDGDTDRDVLVASAADDTIAWYENTDGFGTFGAERVISAVAMGASCVFGADLDGDGDADVLSSSADDDSVEWYENRMAEGDGGPDGFAAAALITDTADGAASVLATDLDGDRDADVVVASELDDTLAWYENRISDGDGGPDGFGPGTAIPCTMGCGGPVSVCAADFDGDADRDLAVVRQAGGTIAWLMNDCPDTTLGAVFMGLGDLGAPTPRSFAQAVSADGTTVVGDSDNASGVREAFRWRSSVGVLEALGDLDGGAVGGSGSLALGVSADGTVVVGQAPGGTSTADGRGAFEWREGTGMMTELAGPGPTYEDGLAVGISHDGATMSGRFKNVDVPADPRLLGRTWTATTPGGVSLPGIVLPGSLVWNAGDEVSGDGSIVVGWGTTAWSMYTRACFWARDMSGGFTDEPQPLPELLPTGDGVDYSVSVDVNVDGSIIVGESMSPHVAVFANNVGEAAVWKNADPLGDPSGFTVEGLGDLPGGEFHSESTAVCEDGTLIVGRGRTASGWETTIWDPINGMRDLRTVLIEEYGLESELMGWTLTRATDISANGRVIVGYRQNDTTMVEEGWIVVLPWPLCACTIHCERSIRWGMDGGGVWGDVADWEGVFVPSWGDVAVFDRPGTPAYTVQVLESRYASSAWVDGGDLVTLSLGADVRLMSDADPLGSADDASLVVASGRLELETPMGGMGLFEVRDIDVAPESAQIAEFLIDSPDVLLSGRDIQLGPLGLGEMKVQAGGGHTVSGGSILVDSQHLSNEPSLLRLTGSSTSLASTLASMTIGRDGNGALEVRGGAYLSTAVAGDVILSENAGSTSVVRVADTGSVWEVTGGQLTVGREGASTVQVFGGGTLDVDINITTEPEGALSGNGMVMGDVVNIGRIEPSSPEAAMGGSGDPPSDFGTLTVHGNVDQLNQGGSVSGELVLDVGVGDAMEIVQDRLMVVGGQVSMAGLVRVRLGAGFDAGDPTSVAMLNGLSLVEVDGGGSSVGRFTVGLFSGVGAGQFLKVGYPQGSRGSGERATTVVSLEVASLGGDDVDFGDPTSEPSGGAGFPEGAVLADVDGFIDPDGNTTLDLVVALRDGTSPLTTAGSVQILYNGGTTGGVWNGFTTTGTVPMGSGDFDQSGVAVGDLNGDGRPDIVVANRGSDSLTALINGSGAQSPFTEDQRIVLNDGNTGGMIGDAPADVAVMHVDADGLLDIVVANEQSDSVSVLFNAGVSSARAPTWLGTEDETEVLDLPEGSCPLSIRPGDFDAGVLTQIVTANAGNDTVSIFRHDGVRNVSLASSYAVGDRPVQVLAADLDLDAGGFHEIVTVNETGASVSVLRNETAPGVTTPSFAPVVDLALEGAASASSITAGDFDSDASADLDLGVLADGVVKVFRNDLDDGQLAFSPAPDEITGADPVVVVSGDLNGDGRADLVTVRDSTPGGLRAAGAGGRSRGSSPFGVASGSVGGEGATLLGGVMDVAILITCPCDADLDADCDTDVLDFAVFAAGFGSSVTPGTNGDLDGDGDVDVLDFSLFVGGFGCGG